MESLDSVRPLARGQAVFHSQWAQVRSSREWCDMVTIRPLSAGVLSCRTQAHTLWNLDNGKRVAASNLWRRPRCLRWHQPVLSLRRCRLQLRRLDPARHRGPRR